MCSLDVQNNGQRPAEVLVRVCPGTPSDIIFVLLQFISINPGQGIRPFGVDQFEVFCAETLPAQGTLVIASGIELGARGYWEQEAKSQYVRKLSLHTGQSY